MADIRPLILAHRLRHVLELDDLFSEGVIAGAEVSVKTNFFDIPGEHHVGGIWKHVDQTDLSLGEPPPLYPYPVVPGVPTKRDAYTIYYGFDQYLQVYSDEPRRGWGLFGRFSISDGNPTPLEYFLSAGIGGDSPVRRDSGDTFGIGWFYVGASNEFGPIPQFLLASRDGYGVEFFYNIQVTSCLNVTPDLQYIKPGALGRADESFLYGLRVNLTL